MVGTVQLAETPQSEQSTRPVAVLVAQAGWFCDTVMFGVEMVVICLAPSPP